jgi:DnaJ-class molecular chaperone
MATLPDGACPECGGAGEFDSALHCEKCEACGGTGALGGTPKRNDAEGAKEKPLKSTA